MARRILTIIGYILATAVVVVGTILLIAYGNGYSYDFKTNRLVHRGLIILDSKPGDAKIFVNNRDIDETTPYRHTYEAGSYDFRVEKKDFRTWSKRLEVIPSRVNLAQYVILIPNSVKIDTIGSYPAVNQFVSSEDHNRIAFTVPDGPGSGIWRLDTRSRNQSRIYASAAPAEGVPAETVEVLSWSDDNSHLLVKSVIGDKTSFIVVAANGTDPPINLTDSFRVDNANLIFDTGDWRSIYWHSADGIRRIDLGSNNVSAILAENVAAMTFAEDRVLYVNNEKQPYSVWQLERNGNRKQLIEDIPVSGGYSLDYATYIRVPQLAVVAHDGRKATLYSNIYEKPVAKPMNSVATQVAFNNDGRFLLMYDESHVATYDAEYNSTYYMPTENSTVTGLNWFDNYHLVFNRGGKIVMSEFDGNYAQEILEGIHTPYSSPDNRSIVVPGNNPAGGGYVRSARIRP